MTPGKRMLRAVAAFVLVAAAAACNSPGVIEGPKLATNQALRVMLQDQPTTLDPGQSQYPYETAVLRAISEPLLKPLPDLSGVTPAAAASYEVSGDGLTYVFHLRPTAMYWDGMPVKAQDFVYAWQRLIDPRLGALNEGFFADAVLNGERVALMDPQHDAAAIDAALATLGLKAVDDQTFQVTLAHPDPAFIWLAAMPASGPIRKDVVTQSGPAWWSRPETLVTNGPFKVKEMAKGDHITVVPNPNYWGAKPTLKSIVFEIVNDGAVALAKYRNGELDEIAVQLPQASEVSGDSSLIHELVKTPDLTVFWITFRVTAALVNNVKLRQAIAQAIDRDAFVRQVFSGEGAGISTFIPNGMHGHDSNLTGQRFDVAQARASLAASGVSAKQLSTLKFTYDQSNDFRKATAKFVHDQLKTNLGADIVLQGLDSGTYNARLDSGQFQLAGPMGWQADYPDPADWYDLFTTTSSLNTAFYQNQQYDNFVRVARTDISPPRRDQEYQQAQAMLVNDAPVAFLAQSASWYLVRPYVRGVVTSPVDEWPGALAPGRLSIAPH
ncbi:MAG TPA: peptide ABC transporter substrate-binding protein [Candidatus Dormibacteraeota bacterium]|nr:peptide ABC transporter substrate-binding protein [Candidatus Dormibacteraeota bacterium]